MQEWRRMTAPPILHRRGYFRRSGRSTALGLGVFSLTMARRLDTPIVPLGVALPVATLFVFLRWLVATHRRLGEFVVAGVKYASPTRAPRDLPVQSVAGYDGQFHYRLALDPFDLARTAFGIRLDSFSRVERIGYPFLAWLVSGGHHGLVPLALVTINVVACAIVALAGGLLAQSAGRHALWGLVFAGYWGYLWTLGRDLTELTAAAFVLLALAALIRHAPIWSGLSFLCAVLSKETSVLLIGTLALLAVWERLAKVPADSLSSGLSSPSSSAASSPRPSSWPSSASLLWFGELGVLLVVTIGAALSLTAAPIALRALWIVSVLLVLSTAKGIWLGDVGFRSLDDAYLTGWLVLLYRRRPIWPWALICCATWIVVFVELVRFV
jgi:hypothetical protein